MGFREKRKNRSNWISEEILKLIQEKKKAFLKRLSSKKDDRMFNYNKKRVKQVVRIAQNYAWDRASAEINSKHGYRRATESWSILKNLRQQTRHSARLNLISLNEWTNNY